MEKFRERLLSYLSTLAETAEKQLPSLEELRRLYTHLLTGHFYEAKWRWISAQTDETRLLFLSACADLCAYAVQIDEQSASQETLEDTFVTLAGPSSQISKEEAMAATLAKYGLQAMLGEEKSSLETLVISAAVTALPEKKERNPNWGGRRYYQPGRPKEKEKEG